MDKVKLNWNKIYKDMESAYPIMDDWLDKYMPIIEKSKMRPIIDLGCGNGNDTLYLSQKGYKVISCDYSKEALLHINSFVENHNCICIDMRDKLPFEAESAYIMICDLSLHYFNEKMTHKIINEIYRIIKSKGSLICRVNAVSEMGNEKYEPIKIEDNYYFIGEKKKRYFDKADVNKFFHKFKVDNIYEYEMIRYQKPKHVLDFAAHKL